MLKQFVFSVLCIGIFGWADIDKICRVPYVTRLVNNERIKYVPVRIVESYLLVNYIDYLHPAVYADLRVDSLYITKNEAKIYNYVNFYHCNKKFGEIEFIEQKDFIIQLEDAGNVYMYFKACFTRLSNQVVSGQTRQFGFIRTEPFAILPYVIINQTKYVPQTFLEGDISSLNISPLIVSGWDFNFFKFCFMILSINPKLYVDYNSLMVLNFEEIKKYLHSNMKFMEFWPEKLGEMSCLISKTVIVNDAPALWIKKPLNCSSALDNEPNDLSQRREWNPLPVIPVEFFKHQPGSSNQMVCVK